MHAFAIELACNICRPASFQTDQHLPLFFWSGLVCFPVLRLGLLVAAVICSVYYTQQFRQYRLNFLIGAVVPLYLTAACSP